MDGFIHYHNIEMREHQSRRGRVSVVPEEIPEKRKADGEIREGSRKRAKVSNIILGSQIVY